MNESLTPQERKRFAEWCLEQATQIGLNGMQLKALLDPVEARKVKTATLQVTSMLVVFDYLEADLEVNADRSSPLIDVKEATVGKRRLK